MSHGIRSLVGAALRFIHRVDRWTRVRLVRKFMFKCQCLRQQGVVEVGSGLRLGKDVQINVESGNRLVIGRNVYLADGVRLAVEGKAKTLKIGNDARIQSGCRINGDVSLGDDVIFAPNVFVSSGRHLIDRYPGLTINEQDRRHWKEFDDFSSSPVSIGSDVWLGINAVVLPGSKLDDGVVIGANAVVSGHIEAMQVWTAATPLFRKARRAGK